eukprot:1158917-Pelagomonas_calceolata.AAC.2
MRTHRGWREVLQLNQLPTFMGIADSVEQSPEGWKKLYDAPDPHKVTLPGLYNSLDSFRKLLILRCFRPDKVLPAIQEFVQVNLGKNSIPGFRVCRKALKVHAHPCSWLCRLHANAWSSAGTWTPHPLTCRHATTTPLPPRPSFLSSPPARTQQQHCPSLLIVGRLVPPDFAGDSWVLSLPVWVWVCLCWCGGDRGRATVSIWGTWKCVSHHLRPCTSVNAHCISTNPLTIAASVGMGSRISAVSLGQGQGAKAAALVTEGANIGNWLDVQIKAANESMFLGGWVTGWVCFTKTDAYSAGCACVTVGYRRCFVPASSLTMETGSSAWDGNLGCMVVNSLKAKMLSGRHATSPPFWMPALDKV